MNLQLSLKKKWFQMTKTGVKTEDYREINDWVQSNFYRCVVCVIKCTLCSS